MAPESRPPSLLTPAFLALTAAELLYFTAAGVLLAATPLFARDELLADEAEIGLVIGAFSVTTLLLRPLAGRWSDRHGRRLMLVGGAALFGVLVVGHLPADSLTQLALLRLALGAAEAAFFVAGFAALADLAPPGRAGEALSLNSLGLYLGIALGPLLAQVTLRLGGFTATWLTAAGLALAAAGVSLRVPETHGPAAGAGRLIHPAALGPGAGLFVSLTATSGFLAFGVLHAREVGLDAWALVPIAFGVTVVWLRVALARLPDRVDPVRLAGAALMVQGAGLLLVGAWAAPAGLLLGAVVLGVGTSLVTPAVFTAVFSRVSADERGSAAATTSLFIDAGLTTGPIAVGLLAADIGIAGSLAAWALAPVVAGLLLGNLSRR